MWFEGKHIGVVRISDYGDGEDGLCIEGDRVRGYEEYG